MPSKRLSLFSGLGFWFLLILVYLLYLPGQQGVFHFDDMTNLQGLSQIQAGGSALTFVFSGEAGALSRPLTLASFLLNFGDWPANPQGFLSINILLHLLNGALLAWFTLRLVILIQPDSEPRTEWIALGTSALWLLLPLLASTSLIVIQRMASLSATFVLAGLLIYLIGLSWEATGRIVKGRWVQVTGIGLGTLLATFSKENGALLPLYALTLEVTVLAGVTSIAAGRRYRLWLLALPPLALLVYLVVHVSPAAFAARDFTLAERLFTQPLILWDYLRLALLPHSSAFLPFHDDYPIARGLFAPPTVFLAILAWLIVLGLAIWQRRHWPWFALAVLWYLGGHLLESTALPLELYYEHRNYVPTMALMMALTWLAWTRVGTWQRTAPAILAGYALILALVLWQTTSLWGKSLFAGEVWAMQHPTSTRAQQFLAQRYILIGEGNKAYIVLSRAAEAIPQRLDLAMQTLQLSCAADQDAAIKKDYLRVIERLPNAPFSSETMVSLSKLLDLREQQRCVSLTDEEMHSLLDALLSNPKYQAPYALSFMHHMKSRLYRDAKNLDGTLHHLEAAFVADPDIETLVMMLNTLISADRREDALAFTDVAREHAPVNPILRSQWMRQIDQLQEELQNPPSSY